MFFYENIRMKNLINIIGKLYKYLIVSISIILSTFNVSAQSELYYNLEITSVISSGLFSPFWLSVNRCGISSVGKKWGYLRTGIAGKESINNNWRFEYGADIIAEKNLSHYIFVQQMYADVLWRWLRLSVGKKERSGELKNSNLSTGALIESGNAAPIPQVRIEIPEYHDFCGTDGLLGLRGHIAYGWFGDGNWQENWVSDGGRYAKNILYHSKSLFWKIGKEQCFPLTYEGGVLFATQFGGKIYNYMNKPEKDFKMPTRLKDFWNVFVFSAGDKRYDLGDQLNVAGNHLGSYHLSLKWGKYNWSIRGYYEHMFEDHSGMFWEYGLWKDCLVGVELKFKEFSLIDNFVVEYFNSRDQAGPVNHDATEEIPDQISAIDDYFDHHTYPCWQQYGMTIGTPLITSCLYNESHIFNIYNNRVEAFHAGVSGQPIKRLNYRILLTKSHNWGTYKSPFTNIKNNLSGLIEFSYMPNWAEGFSGTISFAFDKGELYGNNKGIMFAIKKCGIFSK